jgi:DmsE family decaheme c-type cytochrome
MGCLRAAFVAALACLGMAAGGAIAQKPPGPEVCKQCHEAYVDTFNASIHGAKGHKRSPASNGGCASCHGDGTEHVKAGGGRGVGGIKGMNNPAIPASQKADTCLACHGGDRQLAFWDSGRHRKNDVSCNNCHSIHDQPQDKNRKLLKKNEATAAPLRTTVRQLEYETCTSCHKQVRAQIGKPSHHPIIEGKVACSDCHNPHGALSPAMVKNESVNELCYSCHTDKRGPHLYEHPPVEENCLACHNSHGSVHARLLNEKVPNLCQDCHDWSRHPGTAYGGNQGFAPGLGNTRFLARACINCHQMVHGSNAPAAKGQFLTR